MMINMWEKTNYMINYKLSSSGVSLILYLERLFCTPKRKIPKCGTVPSNSLKDVKLNNTICPLCQKLK